MNKVYAQAESEKEAKGHFPFTMGMIHPFCYASINKRGIFCHGFSFPGEQKQFWLTYFRYRV